jgi:hypothetical protein
MNTKPKQWATTCVARKFLKRNIKTIVKKRTVLEFKIHVNMDEYKQVYASSGNALTSFLSIRRLAVFRSL